LILSANCKWNFLPFLQGYHIPPEAGQFINSSNRANKVEELEKVAQDLNQTNVVGNIHLFNLFLPLVMKGKTKKVIAISTGVADLDLTNQLDVDTVALYAASKAALNIIVAKFSAQYKKDGVLFLSISPGLVEVGRYEKGAYSKFLFFFPFSGVIHVPARVCKPF
jgi:NAD(P)-dependent dehydrogenase (short-subunit alcohol dehydrogenase family)